MNKTIVRLKCQGLQQKKLWAEHFLYHDIILRGPIFVSDLFSSGLLICIFANNWVPNQVLFIFNGLKQTFLIDLLYIYAEKQAIIDINGLDLATANYI